MRWSCVSGHVVFHQPILKIEILTEDAGFDEDLASLSLEKKYALFDDGVLELRTLDVVQDADVYPLGIQLSHQDSHEPQTDIEPLHGARFDEIDSEVMVRQRGRRRPVPSNQRDRPASLQGKSGTKGRVY